jgi:hypothetical protein
MVPLFFTAGISALRISREWVTYASGFSSRPKATIVPSDHVTGFS